MKDELGRLGNAIGSLEGGSLLLVVTGAGISVASGIPTFRGADPDAIWSKDDLELATFACFQRDPVRQWKWYLSRFEKISEAQPNPAHTALTDLEKWQVARGRRFLLVTQNIDTLHEQAGTRAMVKVHGTSDRCRCSSVGCSNGSPKGSLPRPDLTRFKESPVRDRLPHCSICGSILRAHVLFFDEYYTDHVDYQFERVQKAASEMSLLLFIGTSLSVGVTDFFLGTALSRQIPVFSIDPGAHPLEELVSLKTPAEVLLPLLVGRLSRMGSASP